MHIHICMYVEDMSIYFNIKISINSIEYIYFISKYIQILSMLVHRCFSMDICYSVL